MIISRRKIKAVIDDKEVDEKIKAIIDNEEVDEKIKLLLKKANILEGYH